MNEDNLDVKIFLSREMIIINDVYGRIKTLLGSINNYPILCKIEDDLIDTYVDSQAKIYKKLEIHLECQRKLSKIEENDEIPTVSGINKAMADSINEEQLISEVSDSSVSEDDDLIREICRKKKVIEIGIKKLKVQKKYLQSKLENEKEQIIRLTNFQETMKKHFDNIQSCPSDKYIETNDGDKNEQREDNDNLEVENSHSCCEPIEAHHEVRNLNLENNESVIIDLYKEMNRINETDQNTNVNKFENKYGEWLSKEDEEKMWDIITELSDEKNEDTNTEIEYFIDAIESDEMKNIIDLNKENMQQLLRQLDRNNSKAIKENIIINLIKEIPKYDGNVDNDTFRSFREKLLEIYGLDTSEAVEKENKFKNYLLNITKGVAFSYVSQILKEDNKIGSIMTFEQMMKKMEERFAHPMEKMMARNNLSTLYQNHGEHIINYFERCEKMIELAFSEKDKNDLVKEQLLQNIIRGIADNSIKKKLFNENITELTELKKRAVELEKAQAKFAFLFGTNPNTNYKIIEREEEPMQMEIMQKLNQRISSIEKNQNKFRKNLPKNLDKKIYKKKGPGSEKKSQIQCFYCNKKGHIMRQCFKKQRENRNWKFKRINYPNYDNRNYQKYPAVQPYRNYQFRNYRSYPNRFTNNYKGGINQRYNGRGQNNNFRNEPKENEMFKFQRSNYRHKDQQL